MQPLDDPLLLLRDQVSEPDVYRATRAVTNSAYSSFKGCQLQNGHQPLCFFRLFVEFGCFREVSTGQSIVAYVPRPFERPAAVCDYYARLLIKFLAVVKYRLILA